MATVHENIAQLHRKRGRADVALKEDLQALKILEQLTKANPTKIENQTRRIGSLLKVADDFKRLGQFADAVEHAKQGLKACEDLMRTNKSSAKIQLALADSYQSLADVYYAAGNSDHRLPALEKALVIREQLAASNPLSNKYRADLAHCYGLLMIYFQQRRKWQEAIPYGEKGIRLWEELASENPKVVRYKDLRAFILKALVGVYFGMNDDDQAIETAQKALEANRELVRTNPNVPKYRHEVASTLAILAVPMVWKQPDKALDLLNEARRIFEHLRGKHLSETEFLSAVQGIHHRSAIAYENQGDFASAADAWKAALDATEQSGDRSTFSYFLRQDYHGNYGLALAKSGQHRKADQELAKFLLRLRGESIQHRVLSRNCSEFFIIVRGLATCLAAAKQDTTLSKSEEQRLMARYLSGAMVMLGALRETGYFQAEEMRIQLGNMPELYPLHHSHVFQGFAQSLGVNLPAWAQKP